MLTESGPRVIEYNCRFGDPETQVVLPLLQSDLLTIMQAVAEERLHEVEVKFSSEHTCCVVLASGGYPQQYETGFPIELGESEQALIYHAGTRLENEVYYTNGGRVLGITALAPTLPEAIKRAYAAAGQIDFPNKHYRRDIGQQALAAKT
jgi:phosphoribosylamine--glycine ligase